MLEPLQTADSVDGQIAELAACLRASGELLRRARGLCCPVPAIHGEHVLHPVADVREPWPGLPLSAA